MRLFYVYHSEGSPEDGLTVEVGQIEAVNYSHALEIASVLFPCGPDSYTWVYEVVDWMTDDADP